MISDIQKSYIDTNSKMAKFLLFLSEQRKPVTGKFIQESLQMTRSELGGILSNAHKSRYCRIKVIRKTPVQYKLEAMLEPMSHSRKRSEPKEAKPESVGLYMSSNNDRLLNSVFN